MPRGNGYALLLCSRIAVHRGNYRRGNYSAGKAVGDLVTLSNRSDATERKMKRPPFKLLSLYVGLIALGLFLGYSQMRRHTMALLETEIEALGGKFDLPNSYFDYVWQRQPSFGTYFYPWSRNLKVMEQHQKKSKLIEERMRVLGVREYFSYSVQ